MFVSTNRRCGSSVRVSNRVARRIRIFAMACVSIGAAAVRADLVSSTWEPKANGQTFFCMDLANELVPYSWPINRSWGQQRTIGKDPCGNFVVTAPSNWTTDLYPTNGNGGHDYDVILGAPGDTNLEQGLAVTINTLQVDPAGRLNMEGTSILNVNGGSVVNNGNISLITTPFIGFSPTAINFTQDAVLSGNGRLILNFSHAAEIDTSSGATLTLAPGTIIRGSGTINAALINNTTIQATDNLTVGQLLLAGSNKINNSIIRAVPNGPIEIDSVTITQTPGAQIIADNGEVTLRSATISGGPLNSTFNGSFIAASGINTLSSTQINSPLQIQNGTLALKSGTVNASTISAFGGTEIQVGMPVFTNNGTITLNSCGCNGFSPTPLTFTSDTLLTGGGEVVLAFGNTEVSTAGNAVLTVDANQTIRGGGVINANLVNNGLLLGGPGILTLQGGPKLNNATIKSPASGTVAITGTVITQSASGQILADGGIVNLNGGATISGGRLETANGGIIYNNQGTNTLVNIVNKGDVVSLNNKLALGPGFINSASVGLFGGAAVDVAAPSLINNGTITLNTCGCNGFSPTPLTFTSDTMLTGGGEVVLVFGNTEIATTGNAVLTVDANQTIRGSGTISANTVNNGRITAGGTFGGMMITSAQFINHGTLAITGQSSLTFNGTSAVSDGILDIQSGTTLVQQGGVTTLAGSQKWASSFLQVNGGEIRLASDTGSAAAPNLRVTVSGGTAALNSSQHFDSLAMSGGRINVAAGGDKVLAASTGQITGNSTIDLADNHMIAHGGSLPAITALIATARNGGANGVWTGFGITSSVAAANPKKITGLAVIVNNDGAGNTIHANFAGETVGIHDVLVKYTYNGDADLNGKIDADDYFRIDSGFALKLTGYRDGDFDYNGIVDADDYFLIDNAFVNQNGVLGLDAPASAAVPEPSTIALLATALSGLVARRRTRYA